MRDLLVDAGIPLDVLTHGSDPALNVGQIAGFMQATRELVGSEKAFSFGHEAFVKVLPTLTRPSLPPLARTVSTSDKLFLRMREAMAVINRQFDTLDRLYIESTPEGTVVYTYDNAGNPVNLSGLFPSTAAEALGIRDWLNRSEIIEKVSPIRRLAREVCSVLLVAHNRKADGDGGEIVGASDIPASTTEGAPARGMTWAGVQRTASAP